MSWLGKRHLFQVITGQRMAPASRGMSADGAECRVTSQTVHFSLPAVFCIGDVGHEPNVGVGTVSVVIRSGNRVALSVTFIRINNKIKR
ncbi:hypothetical protein EMIT0P395_340004 [Pseudomonas sp. IT-P395]